MKRVLIVAGSLVVVIGMVASIASAVVKRRAPRTSEPDAETIQFLATNGNASFRSTAHPLRGGAITTFLAGSEVDLRGAQLPPEGADLRLRNVLGGTEIIVPGGWHVALTHRTIAGGTDNLALLDEPPADAPTLRVEVLNILGGVEIVQEPTFDWNVEPDDIAGIPADA